MYAHVYIKIGVTRLDRPFTYAIPAELEDVVVPGCEVRVPFGARKLRGFVVAVDDCADIDESQTKDIISAKPFNARSDGALFALAGFVHERYGGTFGQALSTVFPSMAGDTKNKDRKLKNPFEKLSLPTERPEIELNEEQQRVVDTFSADYDAGERRVYLLKGVTGSGKTLCYIRMIEKVIEQRKQAIVLIPEIALTLQNIMRFYSFFGDRVSAINSRMTPAMRRDQFERARRGDIAVMIGPRSALFTPFADLGLIIVDEEHETSYNSEHPPKYHAVDVAVERGKINNVPVVLGSATPSVNSYYHAKNGDYTLLTLEKRAKDAAMPVVTVVDMREELRNGNRSILSNTLFHGIQDRLERHEQVMLFINRRGVAGTVSCRECGQVIKCSHCDVPMSLHRDGYLYCHYCGERIPFRKECPACHSKLIGTMRAGTEKIENEILKDFPGVKVLRMDADTTRGADGYRRILKAFNAHEADVLIGTQMIVKGHDFQGVTLMGILAADLSLNVPDYTAAERTYDLLLQACGRSGRGENAGEAVIQTYQPENYAIRAAAAGDYEAFYEEEAAFRSLMDYPPFGHMLSVLITSRDEERCQEMGQYLKQVMKEADDGLFVAGPTVAAISRIKDEYRYELLVKDSSIERLVKARKAADKAVLDAKVPNGADIWYDFT